VPAPTNHSLRRLVHWFDPVIITWLISKALPVDVLAGASSD